MKINWLYVYFVLWPMAGYSLAMDCGHCFTLETPTKFPLATRVNGYLEALDSALLNYPS